MEENSPGDDHQELPSTQNSLVTRDSQKNEPRNTSVMKAHSNGKLAQDTTSHPLDDTFQQSGMY